MPASMALVHISIGSVYTYSMWNAPLTHQLGVVAQAAGDWNLGDALGVFSTTAIALGTTTFVLGPWQERAGPRMVAATAGTFYAAAFGLTAMGAHYHSLPLMHAGYGVLGGIGWGLGYLSPVSTLMRWFPERKGLAAGLALTSFGLGTAVGAPLVNHLLESHFVAPTYLGPAGEVATTVIHGVVHATHAGEQVEVVVATATQLAKLPGALSEGVYVVGTGDTGVASSMLTLAGGYWCAIMLGAMTVRVPPEGWWPANVPKSAEDAESQSLPSVHYDDALRTPQYGLFWALVMGNAFSGMLLISSAKTIMTDVFAAAYPLAVTPAFAAQYVAMLGLANSGGRAGWALASDYIGSRNTYFLFALGIPIVGAIPTVAATVGSGSGDSMLPLWLFYGGTLTSISFYGGTFSCLPPYLARTFGPEHMGAIHGRVLSAWAIAAFSGPKVLSFLRERANDKAIDDLVTRCEPSAFATTFGAPLESLAELKASNAVTIVRLMELVPPGTPDPTPSLYNEAMYVVCGLLAMSATANRFIGPAARTVARPR